MNTSAATEHTPPAAPGAEHTHTTVDGIRVAAVLHRPVAPEWAPLVVALHGGTYTGEYWRVPGSSAGSFVDAAVRNGHPVLIIDRPGYGSSDALAEETNTFDRQAGLLERAIGAFVDRHGFGPVALVAHSIGGMIALDIASRSPEWDLTSVSVTGMGAVNRPAAAELASLPLSGIVDLPFDQRDAVMFGPTGSFREESREAAHGSYAPTPFTELVQAPQWSTDHLARIAARVEVPVHNALAEHDALWVSNTDTLAAFAGAFTAASDVRTEFVAGAGHALDHHPVAAALHLRQLAFFREHAPLG